MMSTLAFPVGPPGNGALPEYKDAQAYLLLAAENAGNTLPKHALLRAGDWTIVVHYAAGSPDMFKIITEIPKIYSGARLSKSQLSQLIAELPTVAWKVGKPALPSPARSPNSRLWHPITMANRKALAGAIIRLIDVAAAIPPRGDAVENLITGCIGNARTSHHSEPVNKDPKRPKTRSQLGCQRHLKLRSRTGNSRYRP